MNTIVDEMKFYRYNIVYYAGMDIDGEYTSPQYPNPSVVLTTYNLHKETPKGYWIWYGELTPGKLRGQSKWVSKTSKKRYAYPTIIEALNAFIYRQEYGIKALQYQITGRRIALKIAKEMVERNKTN